MFKAVWLLILVFGQHNFIIIIIVLILQNDLEHCTQIVDV